MVVLEYDLQKNWKILKKMKNKINDFFDAFYGSRELTSKSNSKIDYFNNSNNFSNYN